MRQECMGEFIARRLWPALQAKLVPTIVANYILWPAAHFVNFRFVPTEHRILYNNCVSVRSMPRASPHCCVMVCKQARFCCPHTLIEGAMSSTMRGRLILWAFLLPQGLAVVLLLKLCDL